MAKLGIREYDQQPHDAMGREVPVGLEPAIGTQVVDFTGTAKQVNLNDRTVFVRLHTDAICNINIGTDGAAVATVGGAGRMAADQTEHFGVRSNPDQILSVIADT